MRALIVKALVLLGLCGMFVVMWNCTESFDPERSAICDLEPSAVIDFGSVAKCLRHRSYISTDSGRETS